MDQTPLSTQVINGDGVYENTDSMKGNISEDADELSEEEIYSRIRQVLIWITALLIIVLNSIVMGILISGNKRRSRMQFFLLHLSIAGKLCVNDCLQLKVGQIYS
ncbi:hypothetical protein CHS0354_025860 [Potamilus streckersoni]|uniref:Uncharacterized protein n=1 Tax=Potamilus streckersoni TaxID=2493646 RepID=A0AAE0SBK1_9BIVA|nr:hypothetical protein CHS0354_025860 [Potamilus streckersoni]